MPSLDFDAEKNAFRAYHDGNARLLGQASDAFLTLVGSLLSHGGFAVAATSGRIKDREEAIRKFSRKYRADLEASATPYEIADHITDLIGLRIVCLYEDQVEPIGELMRTHLDLIEVTDKTAQIEGTENSFGYKGLHLDLRLDRERATMPEYELYAALPFELQIRSIIQDFWSTLDHRIKYKKSIPASLKRRINTLAALFELADREFRQVRDETERELREAGAEEEIDAAADGEEADPAAPGPGDVGTFEDIRHRQYAPLDAFRLLRIAKHFFPDAEFEATKVDGFTAEIVGREPTISRGKFNHYMRESIGLVHRYRDHFLNNGGERFNAFTEMRHALYASNREVFGEMLSATARKAFEDWLRDEEASRQATNR